jgi:predicted phosphodiesterase
MKKLKIHHISDTHGFHNELVIPKDIDVICHTGDATNYRNSHMNLNEFLNFVEWYKNINCKYKIYVAGNHDSFIFEHKKEAERIMKEVGIIYLNKSEVIIEGIKFWGEPITPLFGEWCFMADRSKMHKHWDMVPNDVNILLNHGPAYGILDVLIDKNNTFDLCGDKTLRKYLEINKWKDLKAMCHGHIHCNGLLNPAGTFNYKNIIISNAAAVEDGNFNKGIAHHGNTLILDIS